MAPDTILDSGEWRDPERLHALQADEGTDLLALRNGRNQTLLHLAAAEGREDILHLVLDGMDMHGDHGKTLLALRDSEGQSALTLSLSNQHAQAARILLEHGALIEPIVASVPAETEDVFELAAGGDVVGLKARLAASNGLAHQTNYDDRTVLHIAASRGHIDCVRYLVRDAHADPNAIDRWQRKPIEDAKLGGHMEVLDLLQPITAPEPGVGAAITADPVRSGTSKWERAAMLSKLGKSGRAGIAAVIEAARWQKKQQNELASRKRGSDAHALLQIGASPLSNKSLVPPSRVGSTNACHEASHKGSVGSLTRSTTGLSEGSNGSSTDGCGGGSTPRHNPPSRSFSRFSGRSKKQVVGAAQSDSGGDAVEVASLARASSSSHLASNKSVRFPGVPVDTSATDMGEASAVTPSAAQPGDVQPLSEVSASRLARMHTWKHIRTNTMTNLDEVLNPPGQLRRVGSGLGSATSIVASASHTRSSAYGRAGADALQDPLAAGSTVQTYECEKHVWWPGGAVLGLLSVIIGFASSPTVDPFLDPTRWWECMLQCATIWSFDTALMLCLTVGTIVNPASPFAWRRLFVIYLVGAATVVVWWIGYRLVWVNVLNLPYPGPWHGGLAGIFAFASMICTACALPWYAAPPHERSTKRLRGLLLGLVAYLLLMLVYWFSMLAFISVERGRQWILSIAIAPLREFANVFVTSAFAQAATSDDDPVPVITACHLVMCNHAVFLATVLGGIATFEASAVSLISDIAINMITTFRLVRTRWRLDRTVLDVDAPGSAVQQLEAQRQRATQLLVNLVICEVVECLAPPAFLLAYIVAYHGPNSSSLGNMKVARWQYPAVDSLASVAYGIYVLEAFELVSLGITVVGLWFALGVRFADVYWYLQMHYGPVLAAQLAFTIEQNFCVIAFGCAIELTFSHNWLVPYGTNVSDVANSTA